MVAQVSNPSPWDLQRQTDLSEVQASLAYVVLLVQSFISKQERPHYYLPFADENTEREHRQCEHM